MKIQNNKFCLILFLFLGITCFSQEENKQEIIPQIQNNSFCKSIKLSKIIPLEEIEKAYLFFENFTEQNEIILKVDQNTLNFISKKSDFKNLNELIDLYTKKYNNPVLISNKIIKIKQ